MASFETVADEYDRARPSYPAGVFDALGSLDGLRVIDIGAGTGIATRALIARGAEVTAVDPGGEVLRRARQRTVDLNTVVADGVALPLRTNSVDLACFAQSWHWLDRETRAAEMHRVLRPGGRWAGWWSHARADGDGWFEEYWTTIERACGGTNRSMRDTDWGATMATDQFEVGDRVTVPWTREVSTEIWMTDQASHSYVVALDATERAQLLAELHTIVRSAFPSGSVSVPYETWLWMATAG